MTTAQPSPNNTEAPGLPTIIGPMGEGMTTLKGLQFIIGPRADRIHPRAFHYWPMGHRLMLIADWVPEALESGLALPEGTRQRTQETIGAGVVMAVGALVGQNQDRAPHPGGPLLKQPSDLLYQHVLFSMHGGANVMTSLYTKREWDQHVVMITDRDIWLIDTSPREEWGLIG